MVTRHSRLRFVRDEVDRLADEIERKGLGDEVVRVAEQLQADPGVVRPIDDVEWAALLPQEREKHLIAYYLTLRSEFIELQREGLKIAPQERKSWLEGPAPKLVGLLSGLASLLQFGYEALNAAGVLAHESPGSHEDPIS